ncbi:MAG: Crp/Fnr family transcriptional regulator [Symbiobacteriaceae bacterium]|nr:Crp/Fnr family transcriptional regulator [Symbiobacteriaceae bacterium]
MLDKIYLVLKDSPLFQGVSAGDFHALLDCLSTKTVNYAKDEIIVLTGDPITAVGILLSGGVRVIREDVDGRSHILVEFGSGEVFGEVFVSAGISHSPVTIQASLSSEVIFIDYQRILSTCGSACPFHSLLIANMLRLMATKNLMLNQKLEIISKRTTREKLLCYFDLQRGAARRFTIPFNREELARYLCVDRSAMSSELSRMQAAGLIRYKRKNFEILG